MRKIFFDDTFLKKWISEEKINALIPDAVMAQKHLHSKDWLGNDFLGWLELPKNYNKDEIAAIKELSLQIRNNCDIFVVIGIGGSYLGARAAIEFLSPAFESQRKPQIVFAGHQVNSDYINDLLSVLEGKSVYVNVISKSGTTTEPGIAFRVIREFMERTYGKEGAAKRIIATTDPKSGALRKLAESEGYRTFDIPPDVGGRFSVLTPVGLLPIAVAGIDIEELLAGAAEAYDFCTGDNIKTNMAMYYAIVRNILFREGKTTEVLASFQPQLHFVGEWWKQLSGESEGKDFTGIFPALVDYTTDLHSVGQWMQEGQRNVFETFLYLKKGITECWIPKFDDDGDGLNYLSGLVFEDVNEAAYRGTILAHTDGGVPAGTIFIEERDEAALGQLFYFFEKAIAISGYLLRVNPFNQPGVQAYKDNMFALLKKPGYEKQNEELVKKLKELGI